MLKYLNNLRFVDDESEVSSFKNLFKNLDETKRVIYASYSKK